MDEQTMSEVKEVIIDSKKAITMLLKKIGLAADDVNGCVWDLEIIKDLLEDDLGTIDKTRVVDLAIETVINTLKKIENDLADYANSIEA